MLRNLVLSFAAWGLVVAACPTYAQNKSANEAFTFVASRLTAIERKDRIWKPSDLVSVDGRWEWDEMDAVLDKNGIKTSAVFEKYVVKVEDLAVPVTQVNDKIVFECRSTKCMHVYVQQTDFSSSSHKDEWRASNNWFFKTSEDAARVALAMNDALSAMGATKKRY